MDGALRIEYQLYDDELIRNTHLEVVGTESKIFFGEIYIIIVRTKNNSIYHEY